MNETKQTVLTPLVSLDTPGKATVEVVILADPVSYRRLLLSLSLSLSLPPSVDNHAELSLLFFFMLCSVWNDTGWTRDLLCW